MEPTEKEIIQRAYELWVERGRPDNREEMLRAEAELELRSLYKARHREVGGL